MMEKTGDPEKTGKLQKSTSAVRHSCTSWIVAPLMSYPRNTWSSWTLTPLWILQMFLFVDTIIAAVSTSALPNPPFSPTSLTPLLGILTFEVNGQGTHVDV
jgi:hypothetical protein